MLIGGGYYVAFLIVCQFFGNRTGEFSLYIIYGMVLHNFFNSRKTMSIIPILFVIYIPTLLLTMGKNIYVPEYQYHKLILSSGWYIAVLRQISAISACTIVMVLFSKYAKGYSIVSKWGTMTLGIYLIHDFIIENLVSKHLLLCIPDYGSLVVYVICISITVFAILCSVCLIEMIRKNKISRILLLGELKK